MNTVPSSKDIEMDECWKMLDIPQLLPWATTGLTFEEVGLQPEFEAYKLAVTPPGVAS